MPQIRPTGSLSARSWRHGMRCDICGEPIGRHQWFNHDHRVPLACGGRGGRSNKVFTHLLCNSVKSSRHPFSLRTPADRAAVRALVRPDTYRRLCHVWAGGNG